MTKPILLAEFTRLPSPTRAAVLDGLSGAIDPVAAAAAETHRFLRYGWFAAALRAYGGSARTVLVEEDDQPVIALPIVAVGPSALRIAAVPGSYWPFRSFPVARDVTPRALDTLLETLARTLNALRIGPVADGDAAVMPLVARARRRGWTVLDRFLGTGWLLDLDHDGWPRGSTLRKNRFHERHLAAHGTLDWRQLGAADVPTAFDAFAAIERRSWIATRTDGRDAKFTDDGHGAFWRALAADPALAAMLSGALLSVDGQGAAFAFDLDCGPLRYAIANSYDPAFARHSPGKLLAYRNLLHARDAGVRRVDWGMGDSGYKATLGAVQGPALRDWLLVPPGWRSAIAGRLRGRWAASGR